MPYYHVPYRRLLSEMIFLYFLLIQGSLGTWRVSIAEGTNFIPVPDSPEARALMPMSWLVDKDDLLVSLANPSAEIKPIRGEFRTFSSMEGSQKFMQIGAPRYLEANMQLRIAGTSDFGFVLDGEEGTIRFEKVDVAPKKPPTPPAAIHRAPPLQSSDESSIQLSREEMRAKRLAALQTGNAQYSPAASGVDIGRDPESISAAGLADGLGGSGIDEGSSPGSAHESEGEQGAKRSAHVANSPGSLRDAGSVSVGELDSVEGLPDSADETAGQAEQRDDPGSLEWSCTTFPSPVGNHACAAWTVSWTGKDGVTQTETVNTLRTFNFKKKDLGFSVNFQITPDCILQITRTEDDVWFLTKDKDAVDRLPLVWSTDSIDSFDLSANDEHVCSFNVIPTKSSHSVWLYLGPSIAAFIFAILLSVYCVKRRNSVVST